MSNSTTVADLATAALSPCIIHVCKKIGCTDSDELRRLVESALTYAYTGIEGAYEAGQRYSNKDRDILWEVAEFLRANTRAGTESFQLRMTHIYRSGS